MSNDIVRALTGSSEQPAITLERRYATSIDDLWAALTEPARVGRWLGRVTVMPAQVGDAFEVHLSDAPDGEAADDVGRGVIAECDRPVRLRGSWIWGTEPESDVAVTLTPVSEQETLLRLHHARLAPVETTGYGGGWETLLAGLAVWLGEQQASTADVETRAVARWQTITARPMTLSRTFDTTAADLWRAFTTAEGLRRWWWTHWDDVTFDVGAGRGYRITVPSQRIELWGTCLDFAPESHLAFSWCWQGEDGLVVPDEAVDLRFVEVDGGTRVDVRHTGPWTDDTAATHYRMGWEFTLESLQNQVVR